MKKVRSNAYLNSRALSEIDKLSNMSNNGKRSLDDFSVASTHKKKKKGLGHSSSDQDNSNLNINMINPTEGPSKSKQKGKS